MTTRELADREIESLVGGLESLQAGSMAAAALIGCGTRSIPPLRRFLLQGKPRGVFQPRQLTVETLAQLGAKGVLMEYLEQQPQIKDPVVRFGEDAVRSTAARELAQWLSDDVFDCLVRAGTDHLLPGIVEALGKFRRTDAMPYFLWALGDGICRSCAEEAICNLGAAARPFLLDAIGHRDPSAEEESPSSRQRRRWVLRILCDLQVNEADWPRIRESLAEEDPEIAVTAARIGLEVAPIPDKLRAVDRLIEALPRANWFLRGEARTALAQHFDVARHAVENEIARRMNSDRKEQALDVVLRLLVNLRIQVLKVSLAGG